jgi:hypothetical protein
MTTTLLEMIEHYAERWEENDQSEHRPERAQRWSYERGRRQRRPERVSLGIAARGRRDWDRF